MTHVFILSRIRELWTGGASTRDSIIEGVGNSAGVVTSAAIIMVAVFSIFATLSMIDVKMLGVGLAAAVLIDATIVRGVVLSAALALLGERAWYLPTWLSWLPGRGLACEGGRSAPIPAAMCSGYRGRSAGQVQPAGMAPVPVPALSSSGRPAGPVSDSVT